MKNSIYTTLFSVMMILFSCTSSDSKDDVASGPAPVSTVVIGTQTWTTKNLDVTTYRNGDPIPQVQDAAAWAALTTGAWCYYENNSANGTVYGKLYNRFAVNDPRGLAPAGWHIPSDEEITTLTTFLGGTDVAGGKMKATGTTEASTGLWLAPNDGATNSNGFSALPGGARYPDGSFQFLVKNGSFWSSSNTSRTLGYNYRSINSFPLGDTFGLSVRCVKDETVRDIDGNTYTVVPIGTQKWIQSNLNVSRYRDGSEIPQITDLTTWENLTTGAWCYYQNNTANGLVYGKLYNWYAVMGIYDAASLVDPSLRKKLAPLGYHIPTDSEWATLATFLGGESIAGGKMKEIGTERWNPNVDATNSSRFTGLPGGSLNGNFFGYQGVACSLWSSTESNVDNAIFRNLRNVHGELDIMSYPKNHGFSVRCLRD